MFEGFETADIQMGETTIFVRRAGIGPAILLLHGFPETHLMWRDVAPQLASRYTVVCADLPGYGRSSCPHAAEDHSPYAKRAMAQDMCRVMDQLGCPHFSVAGHDRGGRVAYRLALDHPERVNRLGCVGCAAGCRNVGQSGCQICHCLLAMVAAGAASAITGEINLRCP